MNPNSIRRVINIHNPKRASLLLLPSLAVVAVAMVATAVLASTVAAVPRDHEDGSGDDDATSETASATFSIQEAPTLTVGLSSESVALAIQPTANGQFGRTSMTVNVTTNNEWGYTLTMQANTDTLTRTAQVNNTTYAIPPIGSNITCTGETDSTCNNFTSGYWGYRIGTTGAYLPMTNAVSTALEINSNDTFSAEAQPTTIYFGAKLDNAKPVGDYEGVTLSFVATTNPKPIVYIQNVDLDTCKVNVSNEIGDEIEVVDIRDNKTYKVRYINGACWMTQNLRFLGNSGSASGKMMLDSINSNGASGTIDLYSLNSSSQGNFGAYSEYCDSTNGYNYACVYDSGSESTGVWYNYFATTAGNIKTNSNSTAVSASGPSICPAGWHLPSGAASSSSSEFYKLFNSTSSNWIAANNYLTAFNAVPGGYYSNGSVYDAGYGHWWSATANGITNRYYLYYHSSGSTFGGGNNSVRYYGYFVRCVRTS